MSKIEQHARGALDILQIYSNAGVIPRNYHGLLAPDLSGILGLLLTGGNNWNPRQWAALSELRDICRWDIGALLTLKVEGVIWPVPSNVPPELAYEADRCNRLQIALKSLAGAEDTQKDDLVDTRQIAKLIHRSSNTLRRYRKDWPDPDIPAQGRAPSKWLYKRLLPILRNQFPDSILPDSLPGIE